MQVISFAEEAARRGRPIDPALIRINNQNRSVDLAAPVVESVVEHDAEAIKNVADIEGMSDWLISQGKYRDNMLFIVGINFGLRIGDLLKLRFLDLIREDLTFKDSFVILEQKTKDTRKKKRNRHIAINDAVVEAVTLYIEHTPDVTLDTYLFRSESRNGSNQNRPMHRNSADNVLKAAASSVGIKSRVSTHTLRKTFGYHQMVMSGNDPRKLLLLQKIFGHSSVNQTLEYIGITSEEIEDAYRSLNLGGVDRRRSVVSKAI